VSVGRPQTTDPLVKRVKQTGYGTKGTAKQWLREAIRIINHHPRDRSGESLSIVLFRGKEINFQMIDSCTCSNHSGAMCDHESLSPSLLPALSPSLTPHMEEREREREREREVY